MWFGRSPNLSYLKIFGSIAYILVPQETRRKLDSHSSEAIFLGYSEESKAYHLMNKHNKKIVIFQDIIFIENFHDESNFQIIEVEEDLIDPNLFKYLSITPRISQTSQQVQPNTSLQPVQSTS